MESQAIFDALSAHIQDGCKQHPETKPIGAYPELINAWATLVAKAAAIEDDTASRTEAGRRLLQLAGLCVRAVYELKLPLTVPEETE